MVLFFPPLIPLLAFFVGSSLASIVFRVFSLLGIGIITYVGGDLLIQSATDLFLEQTSGIPEEYIGILGYVGLDNAISMIFSAYSIKLTLLTARRFLGVR